MRRSRSIKESLWGLLLLAVFAACAVDALAADDVILKPSVSVAESVETWHWRTGVPFARGTLTDKDAVAIYRSGEPISIQTEVLATWGPPDTEAGKSIKWLGIDLIDALPGGAGSSYRLRIGERREVPQRLTVEENEESIRVDNGRLRIVFGKPFGNRGFQLFKTVKLDDRIVMECGNGHGAYVVDGDGKIYRAGNDLTAEVKVEMRGPLAAVLRAEGWFVADKVSGFSVQVSGEPKPRPKGGFCRYVTRVYIAAGQTDVRVQHTFINTEDPQKTTWRDIGLALPAPTGQAARFGGLDGEHTGHTYLLQKSWDAFDVCRVAAEGTTQHITSGEKADGWVRVGDIAVGIRDFWQNYPKELEFSAAGVPAQSAIRNPQSAIVVHFWPSHGIPRMETPETLSDANAWRLPFVHSGKELDFRIPECLKDGETFKALHGGGYIENMYRSNAIGIGKTHDLLVSFDPANFKARMAPFQVNPHLLADPRHIASTRVFGNIPAAEPEKRPLTEHRYAESMRFLIRSKDASGSFGMWNYGDLHTYLNIKDGYAWPRYRRLWAATHYNYPRVAWWLYWRTGDHTILQHARRETRHIVDTDICHWTNEFFSSRETQPTYDSRKAVGGICDYKGVVHWHAGDRYAYNACSDFMLYDYYLTGNRRAWDVAMEHGYYIASCPRIDNGRGSAGQADCLVEVYKATWDPVIGDQLKKQIAGMMKKPAQEHRGAKLDWTPWASRCWELTGDPALKDYVLHWVDGPAPERLQQIALAYEMTGDPKYANRCARFIFDNAVRTVVREDSLDGVVGRRMKAWADELTTGMLSLKAAEAGRLTLRGFQPKAYWPYWTNWGLSIPYTLSREICNDYFRGKYPWPDDDRFRLTSYVYHDGTPKRLWLGVQSMAPKPGADVRLFRPDGKLVKHVHLEDFSRVIRGQTGEGPTAMKLLFPRQTYPVKNGTITVNGKQYEHAGKVLLAERPRRSPEDLYDLCSEKVELGPEDPKGFYKVVHSGIFYTPVPVLPPEGKVWIEVGKASTFAVNAMTYFYVPADCETFEMGFLPTYLPQRFEAKLRMAAGALVNPDAEIVESIRCGLESEPQIVEVVVPPRYRGKTWGVTGQLFSIVAMKHLPPYISPSFDAFQTAPHTPKAASSRNRRAHQALVTGTLNSKSGIRNPKQIRNSKTAMLKTGSQRLREH